MDDLGRRTNRLPAVMFGYFFLITTAIYTVKPAKDSLFLEFLGPQRLPYAFLLTAVLMGLAVSVNARLMEGVRRSRLLSLTLGGFAATGALFWLVIRQDNPWPWLFLLLYSWGDILMVTAITQYWIFINDLFNPREAKRRLGFFVGGGLLGGIAGSMIARFRPGGLVTESLIPVSAALLAGSILVVILADRSARRPTAQEPRAAADRPREKVGFAGSFALVRKNRYSRAISQSGVFADEGFKA